MLVSFREEQLSSRGALFKEEDSAPLQGKRSGNAYAGLETANSFRNSAAYVQNWLKVLRDDKRFIVSAAGKAEKAVSMILG